ncbi:MAG: 4-hydroxy-tetrahydrodipicolinate synthase [Pseudomonadota bacterium]
MTLDRIRGSICALITPFRDGAFDEAGYEAFVDWQIEEGTHALVPVGTTGESPTLSHDEHRRVVSSCIKTAAGRVPVIAGAGSNSTAEAVALARFAEEAGADALLVVAPYYNKPNQEGLYQHFKAVNDAVGIPIIVYNIPGRSVVDVRTETMARLFSLANIAGVKDATGNLLRVSEARRHLGPDFIQLSGDDGTAIGFNAHGGCGCISVTANVAPRLMAAFQEALLASDYPAALALQDRLFPLHEALFVDPNPVPTKYALSRLRDLTPDARLPLAPISDAARLAVDDALVRVGLV